jgi:hypothetical protein
MGLRWQSSDEAPERQTAPDRRLRFNLSLRDVEEMQLERGIVVSYETIRR